MTRNLSLKKTDSQVYKQTRIKRSNGSLRRIWPNGDSACAGAKLVSYRPSKAAARHVYSASWCSTLAGVLRCAPKEVMGLCSFSQKTSGSAWCIEAVKKKVSEESADSFNSGQFLAAPQAGGVAVLPEEQHSYDMDTDQCFMAESHRMPVYSCEGICNSRLEL